MKTSTVMLAGLLLVAPAAQADVRDPGEVETCVLPSFQRPGVQCQACRAHFGDRDVCTRTLTPQGYRQQCRGRGASVWTEIWCRPATPPTPAPAPPTPPTPPPPPDPPPPQPVADAGQVVQQPLPAPGGPPPVATATPSPEPATPPVPATRTGRCSAGTPGAAAGFPLAFVLAALALAARRRR